MLHAGCLAPSRVGLIPRRNRLQPSFPQLFEFSVMYMWAGEKFESVDFEFTARRYIHHPASRSSALDYRTVGKRQLESTADLCTTVIYPRSVLPEVYKLETFVVRLYPIPRSQCSVQHKRVRCPNTPAISAQLKKEGRPPWSASSVGNVGGVTCWFGPVITVLITALSFPPPISILSSG